MLVIFGVVICLVSVYFLFLYRMDRDREVENEAQLNAGREGESNRISKTQSSIWSLGE